MTNIVITLLLVALHVMICAGLCHLHETVGPIDPVLKIQGLYIHNVTKPVHESHIPKRMTDRLITGLDQPINTIEPETFLTVREGNCSDQQPGTFDAEHNKMQWKIGQIMSNEYSPHTPKKYDYQAGTTDQ